MKTIAFVAALFLANTLAYSQDFAVPELKLETADDYAQYEQDIIDGVNWLINTPADKNEAKRKEISGFVLTWLTGSPSVSVELNQDIVTFMDCGDCLMIFLGGCAKYCLENDTKDAGLEGTVSGIKDVIDYYQKNKKVLGKNKAVDKYVKLQSKKELVSFVKSKM